MAEHTDELDANFPLYPTGIDLNSDLGSVSEDTFVYHTSFDLSDIECNRPSELGGFSGDNLVYHDSSKLPGIESGGASELDERAELDTGPETGVGSIYAELLDDRGHQAMEVEIFYEPNFIPQYRHIVPTTTTSFTVQMANINSKRIASNEERSVYKGFLGQVEKMKEGHHYVGDSFQQSIYTLLNIFSRTCL
jgi:hypothetical protein